MVIINKEHNVCTNIYAYPALLEAPQRFGLMEQPGKYISYCTTTEEMKKESCTSIYRG
jgi:hypothetical protein